MEMGAGFPDEFASILRMRNAGCAASSHKGQGLWRTCADYLDRASEEAVKMR